MFAALNRVNQVLCSSDEIIATNCLQLHAIAQLQQCDATTSTTSLVEDGAADRVQARSACLPLLPWSCAIVP